MTQPSKAAIIPQRTGEASLTPLNVFFEKFFKKTAKRVSSYAEAKKAKR